MSPSLLDRTIGHLVATDGSLLECQATILSADTAALIRAYFTWTLKNQLEPELLCANCFDHSRESKAQYNISDEKIIIVCQCSVRYFEGYSLPPSVMQPSLSAPVDASGPIYMRLSMDAARLLRNYKKVLLALGMKEALRCNACYELHGANSDGCDASVTDASIRIDCRCTKRRFIGSSM